MRVIRFNKLLKSLLKPRHFLSGFNRIICTTVLFFSLLLSEWSQAGAFAVHRFDLFQGCQFLGTYSLLFRLSEEGEYDLKSFYFLSFFPENGTSMEQFFKDSPWASLGKWLDQLAKKEVCTCQFNNIATRLDSCLTCQKSDIAKDVSFYVSLMLSGNSPDDCPFRHFENFKKTHWLTDHQADGFIARFKAADNKQLRLETDGVAFRSDNPDGKVCFQQRGRTFTLGRFLAGSGKKEPVLTYQAVDDADGTPVALELWWKSNGTHLKKLRHMMALSQVPDSPSISPKAVMQLDASHFVRASSIVSGDLGTQFSTQNALLIVEEFADYNFFSKLNQHTDPDEFISIVTNLLGVFTFLDQQGYLFDSELYDFLFISSSAPSWKFTGHERLSLAEKHQKNDASALIGKVLIKALNRKSLWASIPEGTRHLLSTIEKSSGSLTAAEAREFIDLSQGYRNNVTASSINQDLMETYSTGYHHQLDEVGLQLAATPKDGYCLLHAVFQHFGDVDPADIISSISENLNQDPVLAEQAVEDLEYLNNGGWASPTLLPCMATMVHQPIILMMANSETGQPIIQSFMHNGSEAPAGESLETVMGGMGDLVPIVVVHNGTNHFYGTAQATANASTGVEESVDQETLTRIVEGNRMWLLMLSLLLGYHHCQ